MCLGLQDGNIRGASGPFGVLRLLGELSVQVCPSSADGDDISVETTIMDKGSFGRLVAAQCSVKQGIALPFGNFCSRGESTGGSDILLHNSCSHDCSGCSAIGRKRLARRGFRQFLEDFSRSRSTSPVVSSLEMKSLELAPTRRDALGDWEAKLEE